ncbi:iron uptake porin [Nostoc sp. NMS8]|uniref:iron uptake porin n=1 Tax=Nostoc sp. NMS8 TaxID=2815392 RepID=UPI0025CE37C4|nr:iron uptake porin [Nostoc sp. NMS8]MBN3961560.1 iron uptake porin [Nostoc sp. NMS8]
MTKRFWNLFKVSPVVLAAAFFAANSALAAEVNETNVSQLSEAQESNNIDQVTSVSQFSDVQPTDWAFQALQSLVERYGCIAGYPNSTYRGNRALTRYEFAAGLNACLDRVNELIATATADLVSKQDLATLQRLQEEYSAELATLRGRVDGLEARTSELEANQFSTTTKLVGEAIFDISQAFGDTRALPSGSVSPRTDLNSNTTFGDRVRLNLYSSFTGKDQLQIRLTAGNIISNAGAIGNAGATGTGTNQTRLGYDVATADNSVSIDKINYAFNFSDAIRVKVDASGGELWENAYNFNPDFSSSGRGAISRYGRFSPIYRQGASGAGLTVSFNPNGPISLTGAYLAGNGLTSSAANPTDNNGLFDGDNTIFGQLSFKPSKAFNIGFSYARTYQTAPTAGGGLFKGTGSAFANIPFGAGTRTDSNNYGVELNFQPSSKFTLGGWAGYTVADALDGSGRDADIFYWAATLGVKDFGREGNLLGLIFGQPPKVTGGGGGVVKEAGTTYHAEALYRFQVSDHIAVTPGLLVIFNPENNNANDTEYVGTLRTTFTF